MRHDRHRLPLLEEEEPTDVDTIRMMICSVKKRNPFMVVPHEVIKIRPVESNDSLAVGVEEKKDNDPGRVLGLLHHLPIGTLVVVVVAVVLPVNYDITTKMDSKTLGRIWTRPHPITFIQVTLMMQIIKETIT
jgi:hypothetical protein